jgi:hypothetical protein
MLNDKTSKFESDNEETSFIRDFPDFFKMDSESLLEGGNTPRRDSFIMTKFDEKNDKQFKLLEPTDSKRKSIDSDIKTQNEPNHTQFANGNPTLKKRINNQMKHRVNKISKEMKKCSKQYFKRVFDKEKKNVLFIAKQVSF